MARIGAPVSAVMYSCRCRTRHNCRRCYYLCMPLPSPRHTLHNLHGYVQQPWDMGPHRDGNWKTLITKKEGTKTPDTGPEEFPPEYTHWQDSVTLLISAFLCVSFCISSLCCLDALDFCSDCLGHKLSEAGHSSPVPLLLMSPLSPTPFCSYHQLPGPLHIPS